MPNRRGARGFSRSSRPGVHWGRLVQAAQVTVPASTKILLATVAFTSGMDETVRRTRGMFGILSDTTGAIENQIGALGFMVVSDLALAAGAASIPGPVTDADDDGWFVWEPFVNRGSSNTSSYQGNNWRYDSKAMRKVEDGQGVAIMVENASAIHGFMINLSLAMLTSLTAS